MNCPFDKEKLTGYYDGELEAAEKAEVERHIASCSECLRELGELKSAAILVKELPRLRAPRSIAEGVAREMQAAGKVHSFARMRRTVLWASAAAAALFIGLNLMYFTANDKTSARPLATAPPAPIVVGKVQQMQQPHEEAAKNAAPEKEAPAERRSTADRAAAADEAKLRESRKQVEEQEKGLHAKPDAVKKSAEAAPADRARERDKSGDGLAKGAPETKPAAEPMAPPKPTTAAAPPGAPAAAPAAKPAPAPEAAEKSAPKKEADSLARAESELKNKRGAGPEPVVGAEAPATHLTLASTQLSKARPQVEEALRKMGVTVPAPPSNGRAMKAPAPREADTAIALDLTDSQIARLKQELDKPGSSRLLAAAPGDPVLAEFRDGRMLGRKEPSGVVAGGGKSKDFGKADAKPEAKTEAPRDAKELKDADATTRGLAEGLPAGDKAPEPRRRVILHLIEVPFVPDTQPAPDALKK